MQQPPPFEILILCTGNICRSPAVEYLLSAALDDSVRVSSAGTHAVVGAPVDAQMAAQLPMTCSGFSARQLDAATLRSAGLILGLAREHRARAVDILPAAVRRTFTLREFARILSLPGEFTPGGSAADFFTEAVPRAAALRPLARASSADADDIADPYRESDQVFAECFTEIDSAVQVIAGRWRGRALADMASGSGAGWSDE